MFTPVKMAKIAIMGLRKNQQTAVSILHDMEILQLEPLSKDVSAILKNERDTELTRQVSDELLRVKALMTVLPSIPVTARKRFDSVDDLLQTTSSIDIDEQVASLEKEKEAVNNGFDIKVGKFPFSASGKASASGKKEGFVKMIYDAKYGEILGAHMIGFNVTEMIAEIVAARKLETTGHEILKTVHPHPTMSEAVMEATAAAFDEVIHL